MAALDWISVEGFKSIARTGRLELRPINVLIGPNGSGKSNFIGVFSFLNAIRNGALRTCVARAGGAGRVLHFGSKTTQSLAIHISFEDGRNQYKIELESDDGDELFPSRETVYFWDREHHSEPYGSSLPRRNGEAGISDSGLRTGIAGYVRKHLGRWRLYHFHDTSAASPMKKTADVNDNRRLRSDGSNLAAFLYRLRETRDEEYGLIRRTVRLAAPFLDDFLLEPLALNEDKIRLEWRHRGSDAYFDASSLSDGTLRFIALATLLLQPADLRPSVLLLDEPELGLHPFAVTLLASLVKNASHETQIVLATQSPTLLDHFDPEDVLVADRVRGATEFTRLNESALGEWLRDYSLGQLWEKNEFGGRPGPENTGRTPPE